MHWLTWLYVTRRDDGLVVGEDAALAAVEIVVLFDQHRLSATEDLIEGLLSGRTGGVRLANGVDDQVTGDVNHLLGREAVTGHLREAAHQFARTMRAGLEQWVFRVLVHGHIVKMPAASHVTVMLPPFGVTGRVEMPVSR